MASQATTIDIVRERRHIRRLQQNYARLAFLRERYRAGWTIGDIIDDTDKYFRSFATCTVER